MKRKFAVVVALMVAIACLSNSAFAQVMQQVPANSMVVV